ncbi:rhomboid family intramembrane serine protease [Paenibacillus lemnae]|uniref:Rhomboid family intramembrane serine protease n=1 Tax=Paenibacillus lemnae TaxID=1330551 RepID=A0A848M717_PAELE|nr:rhomboid family intramembrane serine protease [Paenibacillus lemnae]NMO95374.1 rhomboid family intramembrane serine protease [Paenibacillus lemnae]
MIFVRYENWKSYLRFYPATSLLLLANFVLFLIVSFDGGSTNVETMLRYGALYSLDPYKSDGWRYFASMFLHNGFEHLFFNSFALLVLTPPLERIMGSFRYLVLYLGSGLLGNVLSVSYYAQSSSIPHWLVGASGAIYGVYGGLLYIAMLQRDKMDEASRKMLYTLLIMGAVFSFLPSIGWMAHLGGAIGGFFIYGLMVRLFKSSRM